MEKKFSKTEIKDFIKNLYDQGKTQGQISEELNALAVPCPCGAGIWSDKYVSVFSIKNGMRVRERHKIKPSFIKIEKTKVSLTILGKILQSDGLTESEKRELLNKLS